MLRDCRDKVQSVKVSIIRFLLIIFVRIKARYCRSMAEVQVEAVPLCVEYCGVCGMPPEYCEYSPEPAQCYDWMKANLPDYYTRLVEATSQLEGASLADSKRQTRGGKGLKKLKKKQDEAKRVVVSRSLRTKRKCVTVVVGLKTCDIDLKKASKTFAQHFSCGSSVTGEDEIVIQGDVSFEVADFIPDKWMEVPEDCVEIVDQKK